MTMFHSHLIILKYILMSRVEYLNRVLLTSWLVLEEQSDNAKLRNRTTGFVLLIYLDRGLLPDLI